MRGSGTDSIIGVIRCSAMDWILFAILQGLCLIFTIAAIMIVNIEYKEKLDCDYKFANGDFEPKPQDITKMVLISFFGSFAAAFCGIGPGAIFVPVLVIIGIQSTVATSTGMYVTMFTALAASLQSIIFKKIMLDYSLYVQCMTFLGSFPGLFFQGYLVQQTGRPSVTVAILTCCVFGALIMSVGLTIPKTIHQANLGDNIWSVKGYCPVIPSSLNEAIKPK